MQVNDTNFIRWFTGEVTEDTSAIRRLAQIDDRCYCPVFVSGERVAFYCNASLPFLDADDFDNLTLRIIDVSGDVVEDLGAILQKVTLSSGYRFFADFIMPDISNGQYQFQVYNTNTSAAKLVSNWFQTLDVDTADTLTATVTWRNSRSMYYYDFSLYPDFYNRVRLHLSLQSYVFEGTVEQLQSVNNGRRRNLNRTVDLSEKVQTYYFDDAANKAAIVLFEADYININGKSYLAKTIYNPNARVNSTVSTGEIELYDQDFSSVNKYGQMPKLLSNNGYVVFWNKTAITISLNTYFENNSLFQSTPVAGGGKIYFPIDSIPYNGRIDFVPSVGGSYTVLTCCVVNKTVTFDEETNSNPATASLTRVQVYENDWSLVIS